MLLPIEFQVIGQGHIAGQLNSKPLCFMLSNFATIIASNASNDPLNIIKICLNKKKSNDPFLLNNYVIGKNKEVKTMHEL